MTEAEAKELVQQHLAELERQRQERIAAALSGPVHIRKRIARKRGNSFYRVKYSASENGSQTLCGAPAGNDRTWAEARFAKHLAAVTCNACKQIRTTNPAA
ncbi:hypothetical protein [Kitasatospora sp. NPDC001175]|uniref:hypothetical protein n=1 Tax=Kitasatospora sp. NPDC001175 TaxID=3157103 RepID=UPI003D031A63